VSFATDPSFHTVFVMASKAKYDACDFSGATQVTGDASPLVFQVPTLDADEAYYFACSVGTHCSAQGQKFKLEVSNWYASTGRPSPAPTEAPQPGLDIALASEPLEVSEDGSVTSSFTVRLTSVPVSPVTLTFGSSGGGVRCVPASVTFDHESFSTARTVAVRAVDDAVAQASSPRADAITVAVASADSVGICARSSRTDPCGQAARYSGFTVEPLVVEVADDDVAGVVVTVVSNAATFDNYGDAKAAALYRVALATRPVADVTVTLGGLGAYAGSYVTSGDAGGDLTAGSVLTFTSDNWAAPQAVRIFASAPTADRPACSDGGRDCDAVGSRSESVAHAVASEGDDAYDGLEAGGVDVAVNVVRDSAEPPTVTGAVFADLLNAVVITFDSATNRAGRSGSFACSLVLDLTAAFGFGAACAFTADDTFVVTFGSGATVEPGDIVALKAGAVQASKADSAASVSLFALAASVTVGQPGTATTPSVKLSASSTSVGRCDRLVLDGSGSSGSGGRAMAYAFSAVSDSGHSIKNLTAALAELNSKRGGKGWYKLYLPSDDMVPGSTFTVTLTATNLLGNVGNASVTVTKLGVPAPVLGIVGGATQASTHSAALTLRASASLPAMACIDSDLENAKMSFTWTAVSGGFTGSLAGTSRNPRELVLAAKSLAAATTYTFKVTGFMTDSPSVANEATVSVVVGQQALKAVVGSGFRQVGRDSPFTLSGASSYDPDESAAPFSYAWSCAGKSSGATCGSLSLASSATATVAANALAIGTYTFTLTVAKAGRPSATADAVVEVTLGNPPAVSVAFPTRAKYNVGDGFVALAGTVTSPRSFTTAWSSPGSDVAEVFKYQGALVGTVANRLSAVVAVGLLTPGSTYTLRLTATDSDSSASYAEVTLTMNTAPASGTLVVTPLSGFALDTSFTLETLNWVDEDLPLAYVFGTVPVFDEGSLDGTTLLPFGASGGDAAYSGATLSAGSNATNFTVGCFASAVDAYGAVGTATTTARVLSKPLSVAQLFNISEAKATEALDEGNADAAKQVGTWRSPEITNLLLLVQNSNVCTAKACVVCV